MKQDRKLASWNSIEQRPYTLWHRQLARWRGSQEQITDNLGYYAEKLGHDSIGHWEPEESSEQGSTRVRF